MKVYFDLDGVMRELFPETKTWNDKIEGLSIFDYLEKNPHLLEEAPKTKYCDTIMQYHPMIISAQLKHWRPYTLRWLAKNASSIEGVIFVEQPNDKFKHMKGSDWLVEDCPNLKDYSHIVLIDWKYNQHINPALRIRTVAELDRFLKKHCV
jgi:hypothetical protein